MPFFIYFCHKPVINHAHAVNQGLALQFSSLIFEIWDLAIDTNATFQIFYLIYADPE